MPSSATQTPSPTELETIDLAGHFVVPGPSTTVTQRGATVLYGTDSGNTQFAGIQPGELSGLTSAGLDAAVIIVAGTSEPAQFWNLPDLGGLAIGQRKLPGARRRPRE